MTLTIAGGPWLANVVPALKFQNQIEGQSPRDSTNTKKQGDRSCKTNKILQSRSGVFDGLVEKDAMRCTEGFRTFNKITQGRISSPLADKTESKWKQLESNFPYSFKLSLQRLRIVAVHPYEKNHLAPFIHPHSPLYQKDLGCLELCIWIRHWFFHTRCHCILMESREKIISHIRHGQIKRPYLECLGIQANLCHLLWQAASGDLTLADGANHLFTCIKGSHDRVTACKNIANSSSIKHHVIELSWGRCSASPQLQCFLAAASQPPCFQFDYGPPPCSCLESLKFQRACWNPFAHWIASTNFCNRGALHLFAKARWCHFSVVFVQPAQLQYNEHVAAPS